MSVTVPLFGRTMLVSAGGMGYASKGTLTRHVEKGFPGDAMDRQIESCPLRFASETHTLIFGCSGTHIACIHPIKLKRIVIISILCTNLRYSKNSGSNRSHLWY